MSNHSCFPTEVYESVIDAVHTDRTGSYGTFSTSCRTLRSCALVSRAWRPRSQRWLFQTVELSDATNLYKFAAGLDESPSLAGYVRVLHLIGHLLHNPQSVVALFPAMLMGKLPNLHSLSIIRVVEHGGRPVECPGSSEPTQCSTQKMLPYLPIHPRFPAVLSQFTGVNQLYLYSVSFPSFGDFVRTLSAFRDLRDLRCSYIHWSTLGSPPLCLVRARETGGLLPKLSVLKARFMYPTSSYH